MTFEGTGSAGFGGGQSFELAPASHGLRRVYLAPGLLYASSAADQVTTILGSCVAVCLWDADAGIGGMNHFLLPDGVPPSPRFGRSAVSLLIAAVLELGARRSRLRARIFGGASVLEAFRTGALSLGARNVEVARERLRTEQVRVLGEDVGGELGRKLVFDVQSGAALSRVIEAGLGRAPGSRIAPPKPGPTASIPGKAIPGVTTMKTIL